MISNLVRANHLNIFVLALLKKLNDHCCITLCQTTNLLIVAPRVVFNVCHYEKLSGPGQYHLSFVMLMYYLSEKGCSSVIVTKKHLFKDSCRGTFLRLVRVSSFVPQSDTLFPPAEAGAACSPQCYNYLGGSIEVSRMWWSRPGCCVIGCHAWPVYRASD